MPVAPAARGTSPLWAILAITFLASLGTGVVWNGLAFITKETYGYGEAANLLLAVFNGAVYVAAAFGAGPLMRRLRRWTSPRGLLVAVLAVQAACCPLPVAFESSVAIWVVAGLLSAASAVQWPLIESYLTAGRHGVEMRRTIGWWNICWMSAVFLSLFGMGPLVGGGLAEWSLAALGVLFGLGAAITLVLPIEPAPHADEAVEAHVTAEYPRLLFSCRFLLPMSYVLVGAISPLMPYLLADLEAPLAVQTPITSLWLLARVASAAIMWRTHFWHGRWTTLVVATLLMVGGFGVMVLADSLLAMRFGLLAFGFGQGIVYYAALYYAMAVGRAGVDAAGAHEGLIGLGYGVGPAAALAGSLVAGGPGIVAAVWIVVGITALPAAIPLIRRRKSPPG